MDVDADVIVIALKTRTQQTSEAVRVSLEAIKWLERAGAEQFYVKYCSTFDSTPEGNIGPICDSILEYLDEPYTILCPSLPVNGRKVRDGKLYVNGVPLSESPMKDHPLTPMWSSDIKELMESQSQYKSFPIPIHDTQKIDQVIDNNKNLEHYYLIPDYDNDEDGKAIIERFGHLKLITGGSGLAEWIAKTNPSEQISLDLDVHSTKLIMLAGSCSEMTRKQIQSYANSAKNSTYFLDVDKIVSGEENARTIWEKISHFPSAPLVYSSDTPDGVRRNQLKSQEFVAQIIEQTFAELAAIAVESGYSNIVVAGGETSGAVAKKLGFNGYHIGENIAPGVPILIPVNNTNVRVVLKSGNFGDEDFFNKVSTVLQGTTY
ncbi:four-carbon acid sugar kinase family protein [Sporosarcina sp. P33]|uniref:four-carbon acid sugar kinase family protein n=1 Tax=Sporosarcina sp. P33 TaxID=1930764 RepID=UPI0018C8CB43